MGEGDLGGLEQRAEPGPAEGMRENSHVFDDLDPEAFQVPQSALRSAGQPPRQPQRRQPHQLRLPLSVPGPVMSC